MTGEIVICIAWAAIFVIAGLIANSVLKKEFKKYLEDNKDE